MHLTGVDGMASAKKISKTSGKLSDFGRRLFELKNRKETLEKELTEVNIEIKKLSEIDLVKALEEAGLDKCTITGFGTIFVNDAFYVAVNKDKRDELYEWLKAEGHGDLIQPYVHPATLTAFARELYGENKPLPEIIKVTVIPTVRTRRT
jgi:hypothetical protein